MMTERKEGGQAFPHGDPTNGGDVGMTLRDYFAAQALTGMLSSDTAVSAIMEQSEVDPGTPFQVSARMAFRFADAMLAERGE